MNKIINQSYQCANLIIPADLDSETGNIVIGDVNSSQDRRILKSYKIKTIIACGKQLKTQKQFEHNQQINFILIPVADNQKQYLKQYFDIAYEVISKSLKFGGVLIQCFSGTSRSPTILAAYLIRKKLFSAQNALSMIKEKRFCISPSENFIKQLKIYQKQVEKYRHWKSYSEIKNNKLKNQPSIISIKKSPRKGAASMSLNKQPKDQTSKHQSLLINSYQEKKIEQLKILNMNMNISTKEIKLEQIYGKLKK